MRFNAERLLAISVIMIMVIAMPSGASFERRGGIRALGMGDAFTAIADDASALYWNPAGIGRFSAVELRSEYARPFFGAENVSIDDMNLEFAYPFGYWGTILTGYSYFGNKLYGNTVGTISYGVGFFRHKPVLLGFNTRFYSHGYKTKGLSAVDAEQVKSDPLFTTYGFNQTSIGFDTGLMYRFRDRWALGLALFNINTPSVSINPDDDDELPLTGRAGFTYSFGSLKGAFDIEYQNKPFNDSNPIFVYGGAEQELFKKRLLLRAGAFGMVTPEISPFLTMGFSYNFLRKEWVEFGTDLLDGKDYQYQKRLWLTLEYGSAFSVGSDAFSGSYGDQRIGLKVTFDTTKEYKKQLTKQELEELLNERKMDVAMDVTDKILERQFEVIEGEKEVIEKELQTKYEQERQSLQAELERQQELQLEQKRLEQDLTVAGQKEELEEQIRQLEEVIRQQQRSIEMSTKTNEAMQHLMNAVRYYYLQQYKDAENECYTAIELAPHIALAYKRLGSIFYKEGRKKDAYAAWKKALEIDPTDKELSKWLDQYKKGMKIQ